MKELVSEDTHAHVYYIEGPTPHHLAGGFCSRVSSTAFASRGVELKWEQERRPNPLLNIMSVTSYHILYPAVNCFFDQSNRRIRQPHTAHYCYEQ
jgi:hypothetical protein